MTNNFIDLTFTFTLSRDNVVDRETDPKFMIRMIRGN